MRTAFNPRPISADIPLFIRKLWHASGDGALLADAWPLLNETCRFWECRFTRTDSVGRAPPPGAARNCSAKDGVGNWTVRRVIPPDESAGVTDDSVYTNAAAAQALDWCVEAAEALGHNVPPLWRAMAAAPYLPLSTTLYAGGTVHVQDAHYVRPRTINQADVVLLQYPLGLTFDDPSLARRDLDFYASVTDEAGMFTGA